MNCTHLTEPHTKFCITMNYDECRFLFINTHKAAFPKAAKMSVEIYRDEGRHYLSYDSFIDTHVIQDLTPIKSEVDKAYANLNHRLGQLPWSVISRIQEKVQGSKSPLTDVEKSWILDPIGGSQ